MLNYFQGLNWEQFIQFLDSNGVGLIISGLILPFSLWVSNQIKKAFKSYSTAKKLIKEKEGVDLYIEKMRSVATVARSMNTLKDGHNIERVFLFELSNGGDSPMPGSRMFARSIDIKQVEDKTNFKDEELLDRYREVEVDESYILMAIKAKENGVYQFDVKSHPDCMLKSFYQNEQITYSEIYHIYTDVKSKKMFIMSVATHLPDEKFMDIRTTSLIASEVESIRNSFRKYREK